MAKNDEGVRTKSCHGQGGMASSLGRPVLFEGMSFGTEILDLTTLEWSEGPRESVYRSR